MIKLLENTTEQEAILRFAKLAASERSSQPVEFLHSLENAVMKLDYKSSHDWIWLQKINVSWKLALTARKDRGIQEPPDSFHVTWTGTSLKIEWLCANMVKVSYFHMGIDREELFTVALEGGAEDVLKLLDLVEGDWRLFAYDERKENEVGLASPWVEIDCCDDAKQYLKIYVKC